MVPTSLIKLKGLMLIKYIFQSCVSTFKHFINAFQQFLPLQTVFRIYRRAYFGEVGAATLRIVGGK